MELIDILEIIFQCSLTKKSRADFMLELIDNMMINGVQNPFQNSAEDTLNRIFRGTNSFPCAKAKIIYMHKNEEKLSSYLQGLGENVVFNIETEIQKKDSSYEFDDSCYKLAELIFDKLNRASEKVYVTKTSLHKGVVEDNEEVFRQAQAFCIEYEEELELIPLCQIAAFLNPMHKYVREMYTDYCKCSVEVKKKILELKNIIVMEFFDKNWIAKAIDLFDKKYMKRNFAQ